MAAESSWKFVCAYFSWIWPELVATVTLSSETLPIDLPLSHKFKLMFTHKRYMIHQNLPLEQILQIMAFHFSIAPVEFWCYTYTRYTRVTRLQKILTAKFDWPILGRRFAAALLPRLFWKNPRSHHKGATSRVRTGDQLLPVLCHCQLVIDIIAFEINWRWNIFSLHIFCLMLNIADLTSHQPQKKWELRIYNLGCSGWKL